jgi:hypothetical protein
MVFVSQQREVQTIFLVELPDLLTGPGETPSTTAPVRS